MRCWRWIDRRGSLAALLLAAVVGGTACSCTGGAATTGAQKEPLRRGTVHVSVTETMDGETPERNVSAELITRGFALYGFEPVQDPSRARYLVDGTSTSKFFREATFKVLGQETHLEYQYEGEMSLTLTDSSLPADAPGRKETIEIPREVHGRSDASLAEKDIRRVLTTKAFYKLVRTKHLEHPKIVALIDALGNPEEPRKIDEIRTEMAAIGYPAVPYLISMLSDDERVVQAKGDYPGLTDANRSRFFFYHIADAALGDILRRDSFLTLDSAEEYRMNVITGWTWVWEDKQNVPAEYRVYANKRKRTVVADPQSARQQEQVRQPIAVFPEEANVTPAKAKESESGGH